MRRKSAIIQFKSSDFYLWGMLKEKTHLKNPHSSEELQENIRHEIFAVPLQQHQCMSEKYSYIMRYA
jgi:hypothetical protein